MTDKVIAHCEWCGKEMTVSARGRRRKYCSQQCRQRAYEQRINLRAGAKRPVEARGSGEEAELLQKVGDGLFEVRCLAEDLQSLLADGAESDVLRDVTKELIMKTREVEHLMM